MLSSADDCDAYLFDLSLLRAGVNKKEKKRENKRDEGHSVLFKVTVALFAPQKHFLSMLGIAFAAKAKKALHFRGLV